MRIVIQRVERASVTVDEVVHAEIGSGLLVLLGVSHGDCRQDAEYLTAKLAHLRVFGDDDGKMNRSVIDVGGKILVVPNFTLSGDARKGRRPSFDAAMRPADAEPLFETFCSMLESQGVGVGRGVFRAHMHVELVNDGPVTLIMTSPPDRVPG